MSKSFGPSKPIRMWIDGKCFNIKHHKYLKKPCSTSAAEEVPDSGSDHNFTISPTSTGKLATIFRLPSFYYEQIRYFPDFTLERLQVETNTEVTVPKQGNTGYIIVTGNNEPDIVTARHHLHSIASQIREKQSALQFACIPVQSEEVQTNFEKFKNEILNCSAVDGMDASIFQKSQKLHLTIAVFALKDDHEKAEAVSALNDCHEQIIKPLIQQAGALKVNVAGIDCMQNTLAKVNVLFANAKIMDSNGDNILQKLVNDISNHFYNRGLVIKQHQDDVKLHVTLINTKYRKVSVQPSPKKRSKWHIRKQPFDARGIMEKYKDYYFGESAFDSIHLSYIQSQGEDGFYKPLSIISI